MTWMTIPCPKIWHLHYMAYALCYVENFLNNSVSLSRAVKDCKWHRSIQGDGTVEMH